VIPLTDLYSRTLAIIGGLSIGKLGALMGSLSAIVGVWLGEIFTNQWGAAGLAGVIAACFGSFMVLIPKYMEQKRKNAVTFAEVRDKEQGALLTRMADLHEKEMAFYKLQVAEAQLVASLERSAKHEVIGELTGAQSHNQILVNQLVRAGLTPLVELHPVDYRKLSGATDDQVTELRQAAVKVAQDNVKAVADGPAEAASAK
jgi:hypothetical protein